MIRRAVGQERIVCHAEWTFPLRRLVDRASKSVEVCRSRGMSEVMRATIRWHPPVRDLVVTIPLNEVFAGLA